MKKWEEIVQKYIAGHADEIQSATSPLKNCFGIEYFNYHRIDSSGNYTVLLNRPDWAEYYVEEKYFLLDPYLGNPSDYQSGVYFFDSRGSSDYQEKIRNGSKIFNLDSAILLIEKGEESVEFFGFAANRKTSDLTEIYLNHPSILKSFSRYFKEEMKGVLTKMQSEAYLLPDLKGECLKQKVAPPISKTQYLSYLRQIGHEKEVHLAEILSSQEKKCLTALLNGQSAKGTALDLGGLSPRTVESYLETIKRKFGCWSKAEIFKIAQQLQSLDLLP